MRYKRCKLCGCIIYDEWAGDICDVCLDETEKEKETDENESKDNDDVK